MAFNISEFNAKLDKHGLARDNLFLVTITPPTVLQAELPAGELSFFCRSVALPALTVNTVDVSNQGYGLPQKMPGSLPFDNLNTVFMVDSNFKVKQFFQRWMQHVVNYDNSRGYNYEFNGALPFEIEYKDNIKGRVEITVFSFHSQEFKFRYRFDNAFPVSTGDVTVAWDQNDSVMVMPVQFAYDIYVTDSIGQSTKASRINPSRGFGGGGVGGFITSLGNFGQVLDSIGIDTPIQDIVNQYSVIGSRVNGVIEGVRGLL